MAKFKLVGTWKFPEHTDTITVESDSEDGIMMHFASMTAVAYCTDVILYEDGVEVASAHTEELVG